MLQVGITGGMGVGKSTVCRIFEALGIPVLDTDALAKKLINSNTDLQQKLQISFGDDIIVNQILQKKLLASRAFATEKATTLLNSIVHPYVFEYIAIWQAKQQAPYTIRESALLIETESYKNLDIIIGVTAPMPLRIQRILNRDITSTLPEIKARMDKQIDEETKRKFYQYTISNDGEDLLIPQVLAVHDKIMNLPIVP
jgi:dephospho-CoA kinase